MQFQGASVCGSVPQHTEDVKDRETATRDIFNFKFSSSRWQGILKKGKEKHLTGDSLLKLQHCGSLVVQAHKSAFGKFSFRTMTEVIFKKAVKITRAVIN